MTDVLAAEWLKLRTVRSTATVLAVVALAVAGCCLLARYAAGLWDGTDATGRAHLSVTPLEPLVMVVAQVSLGVLGALAITTEYATGMIRTTVTAVPGRSRVLCAKALIVGAVALATGLAAVFATSYGTLAIVGDRPIRFLTDPAAHTTGLLLAQSLAVAMTGLLGFGLGALLRSTAGAVVCVVGLLYVVPMFAQALPTPWDRRFNSLMPGALPGELAGAGNAHSVYGASLSPVAAAVVMLLYAAVPLGLAAVRTRRQDV
ncbi:MULTISPECIES: hypothetical protein [unclassified Streptomyces]|uniref:hypothetical protein n=1 Tax=unclassified Streptomyces TaxID=2593676 RepID=UPI002E75E80F|nr:hypothetical protein [Streptomyces sp. JV176]MEE1802749.1 ABC transporter permease subunit [Streptomyces sp. JV176]